jgi:hypothetical protein
LTDDDPIAGVEPTELAAPQILEPTREPQLSTAEEARTIERTEAAFTLPAFYITRSSEPARDVEEIQLALDFG